MQSGAKRTERLEGAAAWPTEGNGRETWPTSLAWLHPQAHGISPFGMTAGYPQSKHKCSEHDKKEE